MNITEYLYTNTVFAGIMIIGIFVSVILALVRLSGWCAIFFKLGIADWKALIPFYGTFVLFRKVWKVKPYFIYLATGLISIVLDILLYFFAWENYAAAYIACSIVIVIIRLYTNFKLMASVAAAFDQGIGYTLGLFFYPIIFIPLIGFGNYKHIDLNESAPIAAKSE